MTAVEWFAKQVLRARQLGFISNEKFNDLLEKAKEMEKEQIMNAWNNGQSDGATVCTQKADNPSEEYYNETFKSE